MAEIVYEGMRTPWGSAQHATILAPGIGLVDTASHGGIKLSPARNQALPEAARRPGGWFEEDSDCAIPLTVFEADLRKHGPPWLAESLDKYPPAKTWMNWSPDSYAAYSGKPVAIEDSMVLRDREFDRVNANNYVVIAAWGDWQDGVDTGMVGVVASLGGKRANGYSPDTSKERWFIVPQAEYDARQGSFVIDLARHIEVADFTQRTTKEVV